MRTSQGESHLHRAAWLTACFVLVAGTWSAHARSSGAEPGSRRIVFDASQEGNRDIYSMNEDGSGVQRLTTNPEDDYGPAWSPTGSQIAFWRTNRADPLGQTRLFAQLLIMDADGANETVIWTGTKRVHDHAGLPPAWSPDGSHLAFDSN